MWSEPYLETCCRAALHRLHLAGVHGRPGGLKDGRCLQRIATLGFAVRNEERFFPTETGLRRHATEIGREINRI
jgi:hypothetical protein